MAGTPRIIAVLNQKGGVAKTTTTANLGSCLASRGYRTLLVDMDPQANLSASFGVEPRPGNVGLHDVLQRKAGVHLEHVMAPVDGLPLTVVPGSYELSHAEATLTPVLGSGSRLKQALERYYDRVDYVLIDCPPSLGRLTEMAVVASTHLLVPTEPKFYSFAGMDTLNRMVKNLSEDLNLEAQLLGVLLTMVEKRARLHREIAGEIRERFGEHVFQTSIRRTVRVSEAELTGQPAVMMDPRSTGSQDYRALTDEVLQRLSSFVPRAASAVTGPSRPRAATQYPLITTPPDVMLEDDSFAGGMLTLESSHGRLPAPPNDDRSPVLSPSEAATGALREVLEQAEYPAEAMVSDNAPPKSRVAGYLRRLAQLFTPKR